MDKTPLHKVALEGDVDAIKEMIRLGADIESKTEMGTTPLQFASGLGLGLGLNEVDNIS